MERRTFLMNSIAAVAGIGLTDVIGAAAPAVGSPQPPGAPAANPLTGVPIRNVAIRDGFWSPKLAVWRHTTLIDCFDKFEHTGGLENFDRVAAGETTGHQGPEWWDGLVYEMIAGASDFLAAKRDPALEARIDDYVERIAAAAALDKDGYVNTDVTLGQVAPRWSDPPTPGDMHDDRSAHTVYNAGCLVEAGVHYCNATGKTLLLEVAMRMANFMCGIMGPPPRQNIVPGHAIAELAFVELYLLLRERPELMRLPTAPKDERQYLELAEFWIENRGNHHGRADMTVYDQDDKPVFQQATLEGHAVRSGLLAAGIARAAAVNRRPEYYATARRWWDNMVEAKMYVTGGLGAIPTSEGFGADYELPNNGYAETCAAVAGGLFSRNLNLAVGEARYVNALERELYNGALSGVSLHGDTYFYTNYLSSGPDNRRWSWHPCPCCPPMFLKLMGALPGSLYATDADGVYVNLFVGSHADIDQDGLHLSLTQVTNYPWEGAVRLTVAPKSPARFAINLRVPDWCAGAVIRVNGAAAAPSFVRGYARIARNWKDGDVIELEMPMPARRVKANPLVAADVGRVALMRGPIVYCFEGLDNGGHVDSLVIPTTSEIVSEHRPELLGGTTVLRGEAKRRIDDDAAKENKGAPKLASAPFTAVPFYLNTNREPTVMSVWVADDPAQAAPQSLAALAVPSASHCNPTDTVWALSEVQAPRASDDASVRRFTWWDHRGTAEWVQYDFPTARTISGTEVYWWDERRTHAQCRVPKSWELQYRAGNEWMPVPAIASYETAMDAFNRVTFAPLSTNGLRIAVQLQPGWSGGILRWHILEP